MRLNRPVSEAKNRECRDHTSRVMRKPAFCICENKDADQLRGNREADQRLRFRYTDSTIPLLPKSKISSFLPSSVAVQPLFVWDLVGNPEDRFSHNEAHTCFFHALTFAGSRVQTSSEGHGKCQCNESNMYDRYSCIFTISSF